MYLLIEIIPVLDIMNGVVVHAVSGERDEYKPLSNSVITDLPSPSNILNALKKLNCRRIYIADIDAIIGRGSNESIIDLALSHGFNVLADIGRKGLEKKDSNNISYVIGTEYIVYPNELQLLSNRVVSLDIKNRYAIFRNAELGIAQAAQTICQYNIKSLIVLRLDLVGTLLGLDIDTIRFVKNICRVEIGVGGGLKNIEEINILKKIGVRYILVATAIHKGIVDKCIY